MTKLLSDPISIGKRVKSARMLSGLSRGEIAEKYGISLPTLRAWENPPSGKGGLTQKGAIRLVEAFKCAGVVCDVKWLLLGIGRGPTLANVISQFGNELPIICDEEESILNEIECFKENNSDSIVVIVKDDGMSPLYNIGDYVGGSKMYNNDIEKLEGLDCIVESLDDEIFIRKLNKGRYANLYTLSCTNPMNDNVRPLIIDLPLKSAAEIVWRRKRRLAN